jgi:hypothetical protein
MARPAKKGPATYPRECVVVQFRAIPYVLQNHDRPEEGTCEFGNLYFWCWRFQGCSAALALSGRAQGKRSEKGGFWRMEAIPCLFRDPLKE